MLHKLLIYPNLKDKASTNFVYNFQPFNLKIIEKFVRKTASSLLFLNMDAQVLAKFKIINIQQILR